MSRQPVPNLASKLIVGAIIGVIVIAVFLLIGDMGKIVDAISDMRPEWIIAAFLLTLAGYGLRFVKWHLFTRAAGIPVSWRTDVVIFLIGLMMSITPGKTGEVIKPYILHKKASVAYAKSMSVVVYDRLLDVLAITTLVGIGLLVYPAGWGVFIILLCLFVVLFMVLQQKRWVHKWIDGLTRVRFLRRFRESLHDFYGKTLDMLRVRVLTLTYVVSFAAWSLECVSLYAIVQALGLDVSLLASVLVFSLGSLAGSLSFIPGGLGAAEGSMTGLLVYFGVDANTAVSVSLVARFVTLWFGILIGMVVFAFKRKTYL